jgi:hypothetical protein
VSQLVGALTLPPRRFERQELAVGGYSDVTTRGRLDAILPSQFALDEWDFFRRLAENELLYFRREDPPSRTRQELVVVFDQGVRTWGDVRLVLSAAVLALGKQAARRGVPFLVAATADDGKLVDPLMADPEELGEVLEASDLSSHPGLALERVLERTAECSRDVVLLTHPRSLAEADVVSAARRAVAPAVRLFALTLDGSGAAGLSELKRGVPVKVREFHVDFTRSTPRPVAPPDEAGPWRGDVEPVGFPFRFGIHGTIAPDHFCFDHEGDWLLTVAENGMLYLWKADGTGAEILPRGLVDGQVLTSIEGVVGVAGGFAVVGRDGKRPIVLHYDLVRRTCVCHRPDVAIPPPWLLCYSGRHHAVVMHTPVNDVREAAGCAVDLSTGVWEWPQQPGPPSRAREAWLAWRNGDVPGRKVCVSAQTASVMALGTGCFGSGASELAPPVCRFNWSDGQVELRGVTQPWKPFIPLADGLPVLKGATIVEAQYRAGTLALLCSHSDWPNLSLRLFRGPDGVPLEEIPVQARQLGGFVREGDFVLSDDGERLARRVHYGKLEIRDLGGRPPVLTQVGGFSARVGLFVGRQGLLLLTGQHYSQLLRWDTNRLSVGQERPPSDLLQRHPAWLPERLPATAAGVPSFLKYDPDRFLTGSQREVLAVADRYGQVAIFDHQQRLVCMFFAFRGTLAGWMPDGTRFGPASITGGPPSPGAMEKFGRALRAASAGRSDP